MKHFENNMNAQTAPIYYSLKPAIAAPIAVCGAALALAFIDSPWWLLAIPFALHASLRAQPNLNLADGCLAYLAIIVGFGIAFFHRPSGLAICFGTLAGFYLSAFEKFLTAKPVYSDPVPDDTANQADEEAQLQERSAKE